MSSRELLVAGVAVAALVLVLATPQIVLLRQPPPQGPEGPRPSFRLRHAVGTALLASVYVVVLLPIACVAAAARAVGLGHRSTPGWIERPPGAPSPRAARQPYARVPSRPPAPRPRRVPPRVARTALLAAVAVAALAGVAAGRWLAAEPSGTRPVTGAADSSRYESSGPPEGRLDEPWAVDAGQESVEAFSGRSYDPFLGYVLADYAGDYVNVTDGQRRSYQAADAGEDPYEVWFLGGSALFGFASQRDEHTVPSEVARLAEAAGTPVVVRNFGVPGYTNYQEVQVLADALLDGGRPDLVVFTDGYNDLSYQLGATYLGIAGAGRPAHIFSDLGAAAFAGAWGAPPELGLGAPEATPSLEEASSQTAAVYERGMELAERLGETYGFETLFTWQPSLHSLAPDADLMVSEGFDAQAEATFRAANRQVLDQLGPGVIDLSPALDQLEQPTLVNAVHFNEAGAAALGAALWEQIEPARGQP